MEEHENNTEEKAQSVVADKQYGTVENFRRLKQRGFRTHMDYKKAQHHQKRAKPFALDKFSYDEKSDTYECPAGEKLYNRRYDRRRQATEYRARKGTCEKCQLRYLCTRAKNGRTLMRHLQQELIDKGKAESKSPQGYRDRLRRRILIEGSFAQATTNHHFKRARYRRLWRQQIQDSIICAIQNIKILIKDGGKEPPQAVPSQPVGVFSCYIGYTEVHNALISAVFSMENPFKQVNNPISFRGIALKLFPL